MNQYQELWWQQVKSDHDVLVKFRQQDVNPCHQLHYLQMVTEKISKAYFWRSGHAPPRVHVGFVKFLNALNSRPKSHRQKIVKAFGFSRIKDFQSWAKEIAPLAYELQNLAPNLSSGPNPEYPWPHKAPENSPVSHEFDLWKKLQHTGKGRKLLLVIDRIVNNFSSYC